MGMVTGLRIHRRHIAADIVVDMGTGILPRLQIIAALRRMLWMMDAKAILCRKR